MNRRAQMYKGGSKKSIELCCGFCRDPLERRIRPSRSMCTTCMALNVLLLFPFQVSDILAGERKRPRPPDRPQHSVRGNTKPFGNFCSFTRTSKHNMKAGGNSGDCVYAATIVLACFWPSPSSFAHADIVISRAFIQGRGPKLLAEAKY